MEEAPSSVARGGMEGQTVGGKYELLRLLGQGGMGAVYEARNVMTLKRVAVKLLLSPELGQSESIVKRFFREARASSVVESDHVVQIFDSGADPHSGFPFMVMEFLSGEDLEQVLERFQVLHPNVAAKLVLQGATGLAKAHDTGIIHRDIKPANLFLTSRDDGQLVVKLLDFGIAKVKMENFAETSSGLTRTGSMLGTPLYMSPEQAKGASKIDARSDVWSLGVVLYQLLSGRLPYEEASSLGDLMVSIITADIPLLQDRAPWVPPELAEVAHRAMSRDLDQRYGNAGEMREALSALVPDGPAITPDMLISVSAEQRAWVAPRLQLSDDGMLRATARTGLTMSNTAPGTESAVPKRSSAAPAVIGGVLAVVVVAGAVGAFALTRGNDAAATEQAMTATAPTHKYTLEVLPDGVEVWVDEKKVDVVARSVTLEGTPGQTRTVKIRFGGQEDSHIVALTENGVVPRKLEVGVEPEKPAVVPEVEPEVDPEPVAERQKPAPKLGAKVRDKLRKRIDDAKSQGGVGAGKPPAKPKAPAPKPRPKIDNDTSEFE